MRRLNDDDVNKLRATWNSTRYIDFGKVVFVGGDWTIKDYLAEMTNRQLLGPYYILTKRIWDFTEKLVANGDAKWVDVKDSGNMYLSSPYKGHDQELYAPVLLAWVYSGWDFDMSDVRYREDLTDIYRICHNLIENTGYEFEDLMVLHSYCLDGYSHIGDLVILAHRRGRKCQFKDKTFVKDFQYVSRFAKSQAHVERFSSSPNQGENQLELIRRVYLNPVNIFAERVFEECEKLGVEPFEKLGTIAKIAPDIIEKIERSFIEPDGSRSKLVRYIPTNEFHYGYYLRDFVNGEYHPM